MSLLHIIMTDASGRIDLKQKIDAKIMKLTKYCITFDAEADSGTAGETINVDIFGKGILQSFVITNQTNSENKIPLANDVTSKATINPINLAFKPINSIDKSFTYSLTTKTGAALADFSSVQLWFEFFI